MPVTLPEFHQKRSSCTTILLIDDDQRDLTYWSDAVRKLGKNYTVLTAFDRKSALAICKDRTVDCVLLDLDMPESGFDLLLELVPDPKHPKIAVGYVIECDTCGIMLEVREIKNGNITTEIVDEGK